MQTHTTRYNKGELQPYSQTCIIPIVDYVLSSPLFFFFLTYFFFLSKHVLSTKLVEYKKKGKVS